MSKGKHHWGHEPCSSRDHRAVLSNVQRSGVITRSLNSHTYISSIQYNNFHSEPHQRSRYKQETEEYALRRTGFIFQASSKSEYLGSLIS